MLQTSPHEGSPTEAKPTPQVILVVDDEALILEVLALVLQSEGYTVVPHASGGAALEWLSRHRADLLLLDFMMPGMDGAAVGRAVRAHAEVARLPIVISSALPERTVRGRFADFDAYLQKPYEMERLLETIDRLLATAAPA